MPVEVERGELLPNMSYMLYDFAFSSAISFTKTLRNQSILFLQLISNISKNLSTLPVYGIAILVPDKRAALVLNGPLMNLRKHKKRKGWKSIVEVSLNPPLNLFTIPLLHILALPEDYGRAQNGTRP